MEGSMDLEKAVRDSLHFMVLSSDDKSSGYSYLPRDKAIEKRFIRFGYSTFLPTISADIDFKISSEEISNICKTHNIPLPNVVVETTKGVHLHWFLQYKVSTSNKKALFIYKNTSEAIQKLFSGDKHATVKLSGRVWRNPLKHTHSVLNEDYVNLKDFSHIIKADKPKAKARRVNTRNVKVNLRALKEGERHMGMFTYLRKVAYKLHGDSELHKKLSAIAESANKQLSSPLPDAEIRSIVDSIVVFMETKFKPKRVSKDYLSYNRALAKKKADKTKEKITKVFLSSPFITIKTIKSMSVRAAARVLGLSKTTYARYRDKLQDVLIEMLSIISSFDYYVAVSSKVLLKSSEVIEKFMKELRCNFTYGVP